MSAGAASPAAASRPDRVRREPPSVEPDNSTSAQLALFVKHRRPLPGGAGVAEGSGEPASDDPLVTDDRQIALFDPAVVLGRDLETALAGGCFEEAARLRRVIEETFGPSLHTETLRFLDRLGAPGWKRPPREILSLWTEVDADLAQRMHLRALVRHGVFARLLEWHSPEALVETAPECLPALVLVLGRHPDAADGRRRARGLVRDALLAGRRLESLDFTYDEPLSDLLAEDVTPRWLACLGLIRRLWTAPPAEPDAVPIYSSVAEGLSDDEAALEFWHCLQVAEDETCTNELVHEARRRMKRLHPELHALYMRRAVVRLG
jgi:hypothetical protein